MVTIAETLIFILFNKLMFDLKKKKSAIESRENCT